MSYAVDRLGWLQFQQLCDRLLALDAGVEPGEWNGEADRCRFAVVAGPLGAPLLRSGMELTGPVLVQCAWLRSGRTRVRTAVENLARGHPAALGDAGSYLLICNGDLDDGVPDAWDAGRLRVAVVDAAALGRRIDALPALRLAMPSLLGLRALDGLISGEVAARSSLDLAAARELAGVFVPTRAYERALAVLGEHRFAVITGPPEMGKTAIARMIALARHTDDWEAHECIDPDAVLRAYAADHPQIFIADDAFGSTEYRADAAERWAQAMERLLTALDDRHWLIWTSRPAPLHAALRRLHRERGAERFPSPARVLVDATDLDVSEKTLILFRHAKAAELPERVRGALRHSGPAIVAEPHFTPERIRRLIARLRSEGEGEGAGAQIDVARAAEAELTTATEAMASSFQTLATEHRDLLVALLDAPPGPVPERELVAALRRHHDGALTHPPAELVDRLSDHFVRVLA